MKKRRKPYKTENKAYIRAMLELRRSNAGASHTLKKNKGTRGERTRKAVAEFEDS